MSQFAINFIVDAKYLGDVMAALQPYKVEDLGFKLVAGTGKQARPGEKPAWQVAAGYADATPRPLKFFKDALQSHGFKNGTIYNALDKAVTEKLLVKKMIGGKPHYMKGAVK